MGYQHLKRVPSSLQLQAMPVTPYIACTALPSTIPNEKSYPLTPPSTPRSLSPPLTISDTSNSPFAMLDDRIALSDVCIEGKGHIPPYHINTMFWIPATDPPVKSVHLQSELPWLMTVEATTCPYVTIVDMYRTLFQKLLLPLLPEECRMLGIPDKLQCYSQRFPQWRRIDLLFGKWVAHFDNFDAKTCTVSVVFDYS